MIFKGVYDYTQVVVRYMRVFTFTQKSEKWGVCVCRFKG